MNNDSFVSFTAKDKHRDFKNLKDYFHIRNLAENFELYSNVIETDIGTLRIETPKSVCVGRLCTTGAQAPICLYEQMAMKKQKWIRMKNVLQMKIFLKMNLFV